MGKRAGKEAVVLSLLGKRTENYLAIRIPGKTSRDVMNAIAQLKEEFGSFFSEVFKTITVDNGSEFADFSQVEQFGAFVPKGKYLAAYTNEDILVAADLLNGRPRKKLGYRTPEKLFYAFLDSVYAA